MASFTSNAQVNLSDYKYVVVPKRFSGFNEENQHRTSTLIKHLFSKKGFVTVYSDYLPEDLSDNRCLALYADLINDSSMFSTKTILVLKDCKRKEVMQSQEGRSKKKDYEAAFSEAINNAFNSFKGLDYSYKPKMEEEPITVSFKNDVKTLEDKPMEISTQNDSMITQIATKEVQYYKDNRPVPSDYKKAGEIESKTEEQIATKEEQSFKSNEPMASDYKKGEPDLKKSTSIKSITDVLYAQEIQNGFQLVDSTPKIQLKIYKSAMPNVYLAKADDKDGLVYTSDGKWFFEYYNDGAIVVEELDIKF